ncbi:NAD(P)-dependent oxidoreductase [Allokutzneria sp. NRRL B-24872]|uniref:NAD-dependent epimerase/dehydratase family protein n=1 Tax=Allokutzneria sp. NRRL B-24872 TaxID=1137961 RepID=UPI00143D74F2|nr:NAD-dependent epimerase/dehydratase family protein [Allokutzneria sp. NRRL B-24872]
MTGSVLLTGSTGLVGKRLLKQLTSLGHRVVTYDRSSPPPDTESVTHVQGDLGDLPRMLAAINARDVDRIVHTAAQSHPKLSLSFPTATFHANVTGTLNLYEAARITGVTRIVNYSSERAYGNAEGFVREDHALRPTTPYGVTKVTGELLGDVWRE